MESLTDADCEISGLRRGVVETFALLGCYATVYLVSIPHVTSQKSEGLMPNGSDLAT
jgi:hypothetical protein